MNRGPLVTLLALILGGAGALAVNAIAAEAPAQGGQPPPYEASSSPSDSPSPSSDAPTPAPTDAGPDAQQSGFPKNVTYTGNVVGGAANASIAIVIEDLVALAYFCDGVREFWLRGSALDGTVSLTGKGGETVAGTSAGSTIRGQLELAGTTLTFQAGDTVAPAGVYSATLAEADKRLTWIIRNDDTQVGVAVGRSGQASAAQPLPPGSDRITVDGETASVDPVDATDPPIED